MDEYDIGLTDHGVFYIDFENHINETVQKMAKRLKSIGFEINTDNLLDAMG